MFYLFSMIAMESNAELCEMVKMLDKAELDGKIAVNRKDSKLLTIKRNPESPIPSKVCNTYHSSDTKDFNLFFPKYPQKIEDMKNALKENNIGFQINDDGYLEQVEYEKNTISDQYLEELTESNYKFKDIHLIIDDDQAKSYMKVYLFNFNHIQEDGTIKRLEIDMPYWGNFKRDLKKSDISRILTSVEALFIFHGDKGSLDLLSEYFPISVRNEMDSLHGLFTKKEGSLSAEQLELKHKNNEFKIKVNKASEALELFKKSLNYDDKPQYDFTLVCPNQSKNLHIVEAEGDNLETSKKIYNEFLFKETWAKLLDSKSERYRKIKFKLDEICPMLHEADSYNIQSYIAMLEYWYIYSSFKDMLPPTDKMINVFDVILTSVREKYHKKLRLMFASSTSEPKLIVYIL